MYSHDELQNFILELESIFFDPDTLPVNSEQLNCDDLTSYSSLYERTVRKSQLCCLLLLDDLIEEIWPVKLGCMNAVLTLEDIFLSGHFYRKMIFDGRSARFANQLETVCTSLTNSIRIIDDEMPQERYDRLIKTYSHLNPPSSLDEFLNFLRNFEIQLLQIKQKVRNYEKSFTIRHKHNDHSRNVTGAVN